MKLPCNISEVTIDRDWRFGRPYPPLGFLPFAEHQLGNGDQFGLYWPIGREQQDPIIAEVHHDDWALCPAFSSLDAFLLKAATGAPDDCVQIPTYQEDPRSPVACLEAARADLSNQDFQPALFKLEAAVKLLPEYTEAQTALVSQYRRLQRTDDAFESGLQALISPPSFGQSILQVLRWLQKQSECPPHLRGDPIWLARHQLEFQFGGKKINDDYRVLRNAIDVYIDQGHGVKAATLMQTYGELMYKETVSFWERYSFSLDEYVAWQASVSASLGLARTLTAS